MSVRRKETLTGRFTLYRTCHTCGKSITTTADSPFIRQIANVDGKKQKTCYFCSERCKAASYKYNMDGKYYERKAERDRNRDTKEKNRRYYLAHAEQERERAKKRYWDDPESARGANQYQRIKRELLNAAIKEGC